RRGRRHAHPCRRQAAQGARQGQPAEGHASRPDPADRHLRGVAAPGGAPGDRRGGALRLGRARFAAGPRVKRSLLWGIALLLAVLGGWQVASAAWIHTKAAAAQTLIAWSWGEAHDGGISRR